MIERMNHENSKKGLIHELEEKIQTIKELKKDSTDETLKQHYDGYIRAYNDCINMINQDKHY